MKRRQIKKALKAHRDIARFEQETGLKAPPEYVELTEELYGVSLTLETEEGVSNFTKIFEPEAETQEPIEDVASLRRSHLKQLALQQSGDPNKWELVKDVAQWAGAELQNEDACIQAFHLDSVKGVPAPKLGGDESLPSEPRGDFDNMLALMKGER